MQKKIISSGLSIFVFFSATTLPSIASSKENKTKMTVFTEMQSNISIEHNNSFSIKLDSNPTTGFKWQLSANPDKNLLTLLGSDFKKSEIKNKGVPLIGSGGHEIWNFKALKKGKTDLKFIYIREWDKKSNPSKTATFHIEIL